MFENTGPTTVYMLNASISVPCKVVSGEPTGQYKKDNKIMHTAYMKEGSPIQP